MIALGLIETKGLIAAVEAADAMLKAANVYLLERTCVGAGLVTITIASEDVGSVSAAVEAGAAAINRIPGAILISKHVIPRPDLELHRILKLTPPPCPTLQNKPNTKISTDSKPLNTKKKTESEVSDVKQDKSIVVDQVIASSTVDEISTNTNALPSSADFSTPAESSHTSLPSHSAKTKPSTPKQNIEKKIDKTVKPEAVTPETAKSKKQAAPIRYTMAKIRTMKLDKLQELAKNIENFPLSSDIIATANRDRLITEFMKIFK